ncbi:hypothetical protein [Pectobacterium polaris]|uniref:hypothetical protein n=1 Tax=Pectobacterium polaris TaxID=2042057 RepID=UPI00202DB144|nr:hypothetical protein [Pectobacterium polaris]MCL6327836.1 hypothetical protein [Pectobacterium polaris]
MKIKSLLIVTSLIVFSVTFPATASLPKEVPELDKAPLVLACEYKKSDPSISNDKALSKVKSISGVSKTQAERVVSMLNAIPDIQSKECHNIYAEYNSLNK